MQMLKSNRKVTTLPANYYQQWRQSASIVPLFREAASTTPPEKLLQSVWYHQRLQRDELRTLDGQRLRILHPGFWNFEAGPDFRNAVLQFDDKPPRSGDVEIDLHSTGWRSHAHADNPSYRSVILHVVWECDESGELPTLMLKPWLDSPLDELNKWFGGEGGNELPTSVLGKCSAPLRELSTVALAGLLNQAALVRLQTKASQLAARARQAGWEQALWEGLFRALGYKQNGWPMQRLAELLPQIFPTSHGCKDVFATQAQLLGVSGLLPAELSRKRQGEDDYLRRVWELWWRERGRLAAVVLPRTIWRFHGLRPANQPQRRLALAAHWLAIENLVQRVEQWFTSPLAGAQLPASLLDLLQPAEDAYWSWHWTFRSAHLVSPQPLLGTARVTDLAINVILPWLWVRAVTGGNETLRQQAEQRYLDWPMAEDNAVLRLARQRLFGGSAARFPRTAAAQQGMLQIVRDFCNYANALCTECRFPELVRAAR
jgi:hypothetical protein